MGDFFASIYCWLEEFFGLDLADYLWGQTTLEQNSNMFIGIGLSMLLISLVIVIIFYYVLDHPKFSNWWGWILFLVVNALINFIVGWQWVLKDYYAGKMVAENPATGEIEDLPITLSDISAFGVTNMIDSIIVFFLISYVIKWWSTNCSHAPF